MDHGEFNSQIEATDRILAERRIPVFARAFRAFEMMTSDYSGPLMGHGVDPDKYEDYEGPNLLRHISRWYKERYGDRFNMPNVKGRIPIIIQREIYLLRIHLAYGKPKISLKSVLSWIDGLTESMKTSLTAHELNAIWNAFRDGFCLIYELDDLTTVAAHTRRFNQGQALLLDKAVRDRDAAVRCLSQPIDCSGACFHSQQHAEKMLKLFLLNRRICSAREIRSRQYGHALDRLLAKCCEEDTDFFALTSHVALLKNVRMDIRYDTPEVSREAAVETFWASLRVGGLCATKLSGLPRRRPSGKET